MILETLPSLICHSLSEFCLPQLPAVLYLKWSRVLGHLSSYSPQDLGSLTQSFWFVFPCAVSEHPRVVSRASAVSCIFTSASALFSGSLRLRTRILLPREFSPFELFKCISKTASLVQSTMDDHRQCFHVCNCKYLNLNLLFVLRPEWFCSCTLTAQLPPPLVDVLFHANWRHVCVIPRDCFFTEWFL